MPHCVATHPPEGVAIMKAVLAGIGIGILSSLIDWLTIVVCASGLAHLIIWKENRQKQIR